MENDPDNVIPLVTGPETKRPPIIQARYKPGRRACFHNHTEVDIAARVIECSDCGAELDPYQVLGRLRHSSDYSDAVSERRRLLLEIEELKKERQRLRDAVNAAKRKTR